MTADTQALYDWLKKHWRQNDPKRIKYLAEMPISGGRVLRWPLCLALCLFVCGCGIGFGPPVPVKPVDPKPIVRVETVWTVLAEYITAGRIDNTDTLILIVDRLRETKAITDADRAKFLAAFPGIQAKRRAVTSEDSRTLEGLK